jgi:DNA primase
LSRFAEELAELDFSQPDLSRLRDALLEASLTGADSAQGLRDHVDARGLDPLRRQVEGAAPLSLAWCARPEASESDVYQVLRQALFLHRKARALHRDARDAALALEQDPSESNLARLREIQSELSGLDGREAVLEGFGASSGRSGAL